MTLRFIDSFDHYATADIGQKYSSSNGATISAGNGRRSTASLRFSSPVGTVTRVLDSQGTWIVGFGLKFAALGGGDAAFLTFLDAGTNQVDIRLRADGTIRATRNGTALATSTNALSAATTYYIEVKVLISDTVGTVEVKVNGSSTNWINITGQDTKNTANATANAVALSGASSGGNTDFDDLYVCDGAGSVNNDWLGDVRVDCYMPDGNGNSSQLTGSDGNSTDNYLLVDEASQNGDTDYVQSATVNQKDTYTFADMSHTPSSIFGTQLNMISKKDDSGTRSIAAVTRSAGTDYDGSTQALGTTYVDNRDLREVDPATSAAWTRTNLNSAEFGVKVAA
jgi:hypothetical protein